MVTGFAQKQGRSRSNASMHSQLIRYRTEWQNHFAENFIEHLGQAGVDRGETAQDSFVTGKMSEIRSRVDKIADGEQEEKDCQ